MAKENQTELELTRKQDVLCFQHISVNRVFSQQVTSEWDSCKYHAVKSCKHVSLCLDYLVLTWLWFLPCLFWNITLWIIDLDCGFRILHTLVWMVWANIVPRLMYDYKCAFCTFASCYSILPQSILPWMVKRQIFSSTPLHSHYPLRCGSFFYGWPDWFLAFSPPCESNMKCHAAD